MTIHAITARKAYAPAAQKNGLNPYANRAKVARVCWLLLSGGGLTRTQDQSNIIKRAVAPKKTAIPIAITQSGPGGSLVC